MESKLAEMTDEQLVDLAQQGDRSAFETLIHRYQAKILSLCCRLIGNAQEARELASDVFAEAYQSLPRFRGESKFSTWLYRIASNRSFSRLRTLARDRRIFVKGDTILNSELSIVSPELRDAEELQSQVAHPIHQLELEETKAKIRLVLSKLAKDHAQILLLHDLEELSYVEVSEVLGCPMGTVMSRLSRAREAFRKKWNQMGKD